MDFKNKNIVLTGASAGIGRELLSLLTQHEGVKIIAVARRVENIPCIEGCIYPFSADVSNKEGIDRVFEYASSVFGDIDIFIANAGFAYLEKLEDADWEHIEDIYALNVFSPIYSLEKLCQISKNKPKAFVSIVSGAAMASLPGYSLYCSTKAALKQFIDTYRFEQSDKLQLTAVYPVATRTDFFDKASGVNTTPLPFPQQEPSAVARKIISGIEKGKKNIYPSLLFRLFYPLGRAFPFMMKIYSSREKAKVRRILLRK